MELSQTTYHIENGVATMTLNRPEQLNAFTLTMRDELVGLFREADQDDAVRVVVVTGAGRAFCAGADLSRGGSTFDRSSISSLDAYRDGGGQAALAAFNCRKPVIAAINGHAVGVGITLTLAMDMRIVVEDAKIGFVFARRGVVLEACSSWFLPRLVGMSKATELVYTGRIFQAADERASGLFTHVAPAGQALSRAMAIAGEIADHTSAVSVALCKRLMWHGLGLKDPYAAHLADSRCFFWAGQQKDSEEGVRSFLEKRPPRFAMSASRDVPDFGELGIVELRD